MLTKREYWTITSLILVVVLLFQLINVADSSESRDGTSQDVQTVTQEWASEPSVGDEDQ